jgi:hypothetical protein
MVRDSIVYNLRMLLNKPPELLGEDFDIRSEVKGNNVHLCIHFLCGQGEEFNAFISKSRKSKEREGLKGIFSGSDFEVLCRFDPGEISRSEEQTVWGIAGLHESVDAWATRIVEDLRKGVVYRALAEQTSRIDELASKFESLPDQVPNFEQLQELRDRISQIEVELNERIQKLELDQGAKEKKMADLASEFEHLRERASAVTIKATLRAVASRFYRAASDPKLGTLIDNGGKVLGLLTTSLK